MAREIFGEVSNRTVAIRSRARSVLPVSIALHVVIFACALLAPVIAPGVMPTPPALLVFAAPAPPPSPPPGPPAQAPVSKPATAAAERSDAAPLTAPETIAAEGPPTRTVPSGIGVVDGVAGGLDLPGAAVAGIPTAPPTPPQPAQPVRPGGDIKAPVKTRHVPPVYPRLAQQAGVEGLVILEATIDIDGRVRDVRVLRSEPLLNQAAIDAVMQWRFTPTLLNGVPVPVIMSVTVHFRLGG